MSWASNLRRPWLISLNLLSPMFQWLARALVGNPSTLSRAYADDLSSAIRPTLSISPSSRDSQARRPRSTTSRYAFASPFAPRRADFQAEPALAHVRSLCDPFDRRTDGSDSLGGDGGSCAEPGLARCCRLGPIIYELTLRSLVAN